MNNELGLRFRRIFFSGYSHGRGGEACPPHFLRWGDFKVSHFLGWDTGDVPSPLFKVEGI